MQDIIRFNQSYLPPLGEVNTLLATAWQKREVTNNGELVRLLEDELKTYLGVKHVFVVNSGTTGLMMALALLGKQGEVITTPFTFIATTASIIWQNFTPVFVDIDPVTFCIDPEKIKAAITKNTVAILATHVFGNVCAVEEIRQIAEKNKLMAIFDAAHAFGIKYKGNHACMYGDISVLSFHAYKVFNTVEGGALVTNDDVMADKIYKMRYFGVGDEYEVTMLGINAKMSELHAAVGLVGLKYLQANISKKKLIFEWYYQLLRPGNSFKLPATDPDTIPNFGYFYIEMANEQQLLKCSEMLKAAGVMSKRYFYPSLNTVPYINSKQPMPISEDISRRILHLPSHYYLTYEDVKTIAGIVNKSLD